MPEPLDSMMLAMRSSQNCWTKSIPALAVTSSNRSLGPAGIGGVTEKEGGRAASTAGSYDFGLHAASVRASSSSTGPPQALNPEFRLVFFIHAKSGSTVSGNKGARAIPVILWLLVAKLIAWPRRSVSLRIPPFFVSVARSAEQDIWGVHLLTIEI